MHKMKTPFYSPNTVLMVKPVQFGFNEEAYVTNKFQQKVDNLSQNEVQEKALQEFNLFVEKLKYYSHPCKKILGLKNQKLLS